MFGRPFPRVFNFLLELSHNLVISLDCCEIFRQRLTEYRSAISVKEVYLYAATFDGFVRVVSNLYPSFQVRIVVLVVEIRHDEEVFDVNVRCAEEVDITVDAAQSPHVLVFKVAPVAPS